MGIAVGGFYLEGAFAQFQDRNIESAAAEVVHGHGFILFLIQAVSQSRRGGLIDDTQDIQPRDGPGVFGRLALGIIEVRRYGNDRVGYLFPQVRFRIGL